MTQTNVFRTTGGKCRTEKIVSGMRAQSAMEYLMTYGWAVLIIGVILGAMFNLGVFSSSSLAGTSCLGATGFTCQNPSMIPTGVITFLFGQATGKPMYNVQFECVASTGANNLPNPSNAFNSMASTGAMLPYSDSGNTLSNGQSITVSALQCYDTNGNLITSLAVGAAYSGYVYINYTTLNVAHSGLTNPWFTTKALVIRTKVV